MHRCLDDDEVLELVEGRLAADVLRAFELHLDRCPGCLDAVAAAVRLVGDEPVEDDVSRVGGGRYQLVAPIGYGGSGVVYRARDRSTGAWLAVKTVQLAAPDVLAAIRREVQVLSRLRHPGIVRVVDHGVDGGRPWYAMELLEGGSLAALRLAGAGQLPRVLMIVRRLCEPLAFLHGEGIVHRDLKPQNIFLRADDEVVLADFGHIGHTVGRHGREVIDVLGVNGTPAYMAPEQIAGEPIDARTDLYALGCILHELIAGHPPFVGTTAAEILEQHLTCAPPPLAETIDGVPPELAELVASLLRKDPRDRVGHADDVALALERLGARSTASRLARVAPLYRPSLHGRGEVLARLEAKVDAARAGRGGLVVVAGESGVGKTFVVSELARRARGLRVVSGSCLPTEAAGSGAAVLKPFVAVLDALADRCIGEGADAGERLFGARGRVLAAVAPRLASLAGHDEHPAPAGLVGTAARDRLFTALAETLEAFAREHPLLVLVDDLQWADDLTLGFLAGLDASFFARTRLLVVATCRSDEGAATLAALDDRSGREVLHLRGLDARAVESLVADMLAQTPPATLPSRVFERSDGNPFFVTEMIRAAVASGLIRRVDGAWVADADVGEALVIPPTLGDLVQRRLSDLDPVSRRLVEVAAVLGRELDAALVRRVVEAGELSPDLAMEATADLLRRQVLEQPTPRRLRFVHHALQEIVYRDITPGTKRRLHRSAAAAIEAEYGTEIEAHFPVLGRHLAEAGEAARAAGYFERAGTAALAVAAYGDAATAFTRALELVGATADALDRARLLLGLARASLGLGEAAHSEVHALGALRSLGLQPPRRRGAWRALLIAEIGTQLRHLLLGPPRTPREDARGERIRAHAGSLLSQRYFYRDDLLAMASTALLSINAAERGGSAAEIPGSYTTMGGIVGLLGADRVSARYFARARDAAARAHDVGEEAMARATEAVVHASVGRWTRAREIATHLETAWLPRLTDPMIRAHVVLLACHVSHHTGHDGEARRHADAFLAEAEITGNIQHRMWAQYAVARSLCTDGRCREALPLLEDALRAIALRPEPQSELPCVGLMALACLRTGDRARASSLADRGLALIERIYPTGFAFLDGCVPLAEVYRALLAAPEAPRADARWASLRRAIRRLSLLYPIARPRAFLEEGHRHRRARRRRLAYTFFALAARSARGYAMVREVASAEDAIRDLASG